MLLAAWALAFFTGCSSVAPPGATTQKVTLGDQTFTLELALDDATRFQGLSDRKEIASDGGMLFVFPEVRELNFVMRRCLTPIDVVFLDPGGRIVAWHAMQVVPYDTPERDLRLYGSQWPAQFAIELRGGTARALGLKVGQAVKLPLDELKRRAR